MCGRYTLAVFDPKVVVDALDAEVPRRFDLDPRYNLAPTQLAPIVVPAERPVLTTARWGLELRSGSAPVINVRWESAASRFGWLVRRDGRCVVPADGFYEWTGPKGHRRPLWFHHADRSPIWLAGVLSRRGDTLTYAIITTEAEGAVARVHDRMPLRLSDEGARQWLAGPGEPEPDDQELVATPASTRVNSVANDDPTLLEALEAEEGEAAPASTRRRKATPARRRRAA